ncbi:MAG TPA: LysR substrate-binding domain-containing protein [Rhizomicrobium sp.]|nr:LysR substrate-binding domain-containing protein [Rhizomicrobium sp.]
MVINLPTELLRSFAAIVDAGSMLRATERVFVTQSALSLQMKRLEDLVQIPLFQREGRRLTLTPAGENLLGHARAILDANDRAVQALSGDVLFGPVRIGLVEDFAENLLGSVLPRFGEIHPEAKVQVQIGGSTELLEFLQSGQLDVVLCLSASDDPAAIRTAPMRWLGNAGLIRQEVLPMAFLERRCRFRETALAALEKAGRRYRIVLETPSLAALRAAVESGLAITCRTIHFLDAPIVARNTLPPLPAVAYVRHVRSNHPAITSLADLIQAAALAL